MSALRNLCLVLLWLSVGDGIALAGNAPIHEENPVFGDEKDDPVSHKHPPNRLVDETSPYLLQHAHNPVQWYPWGEEAFERAKKEGKPIFLSIGYAACHWCHVMERESFEDEAIAKVMNEQFINVKVDREERPDVDSIYMKYVQGTTGHGGWPMSVFLTPDLEPFFGGTYFPPDNRPGIYGFSTILNSLSQAWKTQREEIVKSGRQAVEFLAANSEDFGVEEIPSKDLLETAVSSLREVFDEEHGGFGNAPKFPHSMDISLLLRWANRQGDKETLAMATHTLDKMAGGGMYDQLGGGFHRYSVDAEWLVPHFEKMLYDNALLVGSYIDGWLSTGRESYRRVVFETLDFVLRELTHERGGFFSTLDADSEGEEGKFYVFEDEEIDQVLGQSKETAFFKDYYGVTKGGNFEHQSNILNTPRALEEVASEHDLKIDEAMASIERSKQALFDYRAQRVRPGLDDKVLTSWNGLMIAAIARAGAVFDVPRYREAATRAAQFVFEELHVEGRLLRTWRNGQAKYAAYLDDYAFLCRGLIQLYQATFDEQWIRRARELAGVLNTHFRDDEDGGFYFTAKDHEKLIARLKDPYDGALPAGNAVAAEAFLALHVLSGDAGYQKTVEETFKAFGDGMMRAPRAFSQMISVLDHYYSPRQTVVVAGTRGDANVEAMLKATRALYLPNTILALTTEAGPSEESKELMAILEGRLAKEGKPTAYVCEGFVCKAPVTEVSALESLLQTR